MKRNRPVYPIPRPWSPEPPGAPVESGNTPGQDLGEAPRRLTPPADGIAQQMAALRARHAAEEQELLAAAERKAAEDKAAAKAAEPVVAGEEYVGIKDLCKRIPYATKTIRHLMMRGELRLGTHYFKPSGKLIFKVSAVTAWIEGQR